MPKALCIAALAISFIVLIFFLSDFMFSLLGMVQLAPFKGASKLLDIVFSVCAAVLGYLSWKTYKEQL